MTYHYSRPRSVYIPSNQAQSSTGQRPFSVYTQSNQAQPLAGQRPYSVVGYEGFEGFEGFEGLSTLQQQPSIRVIRRRQQRKNVRSNVLNPTLDNFYKTLRRAEADLNVKSAKSWLKEYEGYRKQVINAEKSSIVNTRPASCYTPSLVSSPSTMEYQRYSMHF